MAELDPLFLDGLANNLSGLTERATFQPLAQGVLGDPDLLVTPGGGLRELLVAPGMGMVPGSTPGVFMQGLYAARNDAARSSTLFEVQAAAGGVPAAPGPVPPPDATNPRLDQIVCRVWDHAADGTGLRKWRLAVVPGVPAAGVTLDNRTGAVADGAMPPNWLRLADVITRPGMTTYPAADVRDRRPRARGQRLTVSGTVASPATNATAPVASDLAITAEFNGRPLLIGFSAQILNNATGAYVAMQTFVDGVGQGVAAAAQMSAANLTMWLTRQVLLWTLAPGRHTLEARFYGSGGTTTLSGTARDLTIIEL